MKSAKFNPFKKYIVCMIRDWEHLSAHYTKTNRLNLSSFFHFRFIPVFIFRTSSFSHSKNLTLLSKSLFLLNYFLFGCEIPPSALIAPGLVMPHPNGVILGAKRIGRNAIIFQQVTIGSSLPDFKYNLNLRPTLGNNVFVGAGAKILGGIIVGNNCRIGANTVIASNLSSNLTVICCHYIKKY